MTLPRIPFWATFFTLCGVVILCSLGTWQLQRLHWKEDIISKIAIARAQSAYPALSGAQIAQNGVAWMPVSVRGYFGRRSFHVVPRTHEGKTGSHLFTPLILEDGNVILVNRGWVPHGKMNAKFGRAGTVAISGLLRPMPRANMFTPQNAPEKNEWYQVDMAQMAKAARVKDFLPLVLYAERESGNPALPVRAALNVDPANNHLQYAVFWFTMAGIMLAIYGLRFFGRE